MKYPYVAGVSYKGQNYFYKFYVSEGKYYMLDDAYSHVLSERLYNEDRLEDVTEAFLHCAVIEVESKSQLELLKGLVSKQGMRYRWMEGSGYYCFNPVGYTLYFSTEDLMIDHLDTRSNEFDYYTKGPLSKWNVRYLPDLSEAKVYL